MSAEPIEAESLEHLRQEQEKDRRWGPVVKHIQKYSKYWEAQTMKDLPPKVRESMSSQDKQVYPVYRRAFEIDSDGVLRKKKHLKEQGSQKEYLTVCVPEKFVTGILRFHHGTPVSGHLGINKLKKIVCKRFHWPKMVKSINKWVNGCAPCQRRKQYRRTNYGLFKSTVSTRPWQRACMDLVGPLPETDNHNVYLLTIVDTFSRWPLAIPLPNKKAETIAEAIHKHLITVHGCPEELFSDQEATLISEAVNSMCKRLGIKRLTSSCYAPWQNGHVERFHRFLGASLSIYAADHKRDWDRWVDCVLFTYRVSVHSQTGESPYRIIYNRDPVLGGDIFNKNYPNQEHIEGKSSNQITDELFKWFEEIAKKQQALVNRSNDKKNTEGKRRDPGFKRGDWVLMYEPPVTHSTSKRPWTVPKKFQDVLTGPHRVTSDTRTSKGEMKVLHSRRGREEDVHISRLVLYNPWSDQFLDTADGSLVPGHDIRNNRREEKEEAEESKMEYRWGDEVELGEFVIIQIAADDFHKVPFLIAKVYELGRLEDVGEESIHEGVKYRSLKARIYGNTKGDPANVIKPGWVDKNSRHYFSSKPTHYTHTPYTTVISHGPMSTYNIILAGFEKSETSEKIPGSVLETLRSYDFLDWE